MGIFIKMLKCYFSNHTQLFFNAGTLTYTLVFCSQRLVLHLVMLVRAKIPTDKGLVEEYLCLTVFLCKSKYSMKNFAKYFKNYIYVYVFAKYIAKFTLHIQGLREQLSILTVAACKMHCCKLTRMPTSKANRDKVPAKTCQHAPLI